MSRSRSGWRATGTPQPQPTSRTCPRPGCAPASRPARGRARARGRHRRGRHGRSRYSRSSSTGSTSMKRRLSAAPSAPKRILTASNVVTGRGIPGDLSYLIGPAHVDACAGRWSRPDRRARPRPMRSEPMRARTVDRVGEVLLHRPPFRTVSLSAFRPVFLPHRNPRPSRKAQAAGRINLPASAQTEYVHSS
jgi:hypothetical protein